MSSGQAATMRFDAEPACAAAARRFVVAALEGWDLGRFEDDAALCGSELATNAVLHTRTAFTVSVRPAGSGIRLDVQDDRPDRLPQLPPPDVGPLQIGTTGRGLILVASVASRWGYFTTALAKTVWVELVDDSHPEVASPLVELAHRKTGEGASAIRLVGLPVRAALDSGVQVDDLVRELQLQPERLRADEQATFLELLEKSAPPRLAGRHAAYRAASQGLDRFDLELDVTPEGVRAVTELTAFLEDLAGRAVLTAGRVDPDVIAMRSWLPGEVGSQLRGEAPTPYPE